uniref:Uncharacterized protein n=2 Tax=Euplotes harpa TaxID=151035 RepID=A0A7S3N2P5_9SPIT|mmetsp:Transcript_14314/g.16535  ORF Transcript_14314/g.16535 Transcript_14314/m.16535 type:complete len:384 (+) Transcript_14314:113-1264(+)
MQQDYLWSQRQEQDRVDKRLRQKQYLDELDQQRRLKEKRDFEDKEKLRREMEEKMAKVKQLEADHDLQKAEELKRERDDMLKWAKQNKRDKELEREREKQEYLALCERANQKARSKEDALAEYYRQLDGQMKSNLDTHKKLVYDPEQEKLAKLRSIQDRNEEEFLRKQAKGDDFGVIDRLKNNQLIYAENDKMLKNKQYMKDLEKMKQLEDGINAQGERNAFQIGTEVDLEVERQKKNLYKQTLLYQQAMNEHNKHNFGKMTDAEKRFNKLDLKAYRNKQPQVYSLVPGINNIETYKNSPDMSSKKSIFGEMGQMPLTTRYDAKKGGYPYKPQFNSTSRGLNAVQSMLLLPDTNSIRSSKASVYGDGKRESVLQTSARNSLQL